MTTNAPAPEPVHLEIVRAAVTPNQGVEAWNEYQAMKRALVTPDDVQQIQGRDFLKKSYWRKISKVYRLDLERIRDDYEDTPDGPRIFYAVYRAHHPSGAYCDGDGLDYAAAIEEYHNARATAHTRAKNRAISDLVGGGEVSAEEMGRPRPHAGEDTTARPEQLGEYWCKEHDTAWFRKGKMQNYAHPIGNTGQWCNKPTAPPSPSSATSTSPLLSPPPTPTSSPAPSPPPTVESTQKQGAPSLTGLEFTVWCKEHGLGKARVAELLGAPGKDLATALSNRTYAQAKTDIEAALAKKPATPTANADDDNPS